MTDEQILTNLRNGGQDREKAWEFIFKNWRGLWLTAIRQQGGSDHDADDAMQEISMAFQKRVTSPDFALTHKLSTFLVKCALYRWLSVKKKTPPAKEFEDSDIRGFVESVENARLGGDPRTALDQLIAVLGQTCRKVLTLFSQGFSHEKIADAMGWANARRSINEKAECQAKLVNYLREHSLFAQHIKDLWHGKPVLN